MMTTKRSIAISVGLAAAMFAVGGADAQTFELRWGETPVERATAVRVDADGLALRTTDGERVVSLDRVLGVGGDLADEWTALEPSAKTLWRARTRIERGDLASAESMLEALVPTLGVGNGETAVTVWTGLLRCRLERGGITGSIEAFVQYRARRATPGAEASMFRSGSSSALDGAMIDGVSMLCPSLPPIFVATPAIAAAARSWTAETMPETALAALYRTAISHEIAAGPSVFPSAEDGDGVAMVRDIVKARCGTSEERASARVMLLDRLGRDQPGWVQAWCRCALGRSLLMEGDEESTLMGIAELLRVPAALSDEVPYLTGVSLAEAAVAMAERGDTASALRLRAEIVETLPGHPVLDWPRLKTVGISRPAVAVPDPSSTVPGETR